MANLPKRLVIHPAALLLALAGSLTGCLGNQEDTQIDLAGEGAAIVHADPFLPIPDFGAVGMLRRKGAEDGICSLTLIHPRVAITAAHCFKQLGQRCESEEEAKARLEVVFSGPGDAAHLTAFNIRSIALTPNAFPSQISACPATPYYTCDNDYIKQTVDPSRDVALILLDSAVPASVTTPMSVITSIIDDLDTKYTTHLGLSGDAHFAERNGWVAGWGVSDHCGIGRHAGQMVFEDGTLDGRADWFWAKACISHLACDGEFMPYSDPRCGGAPAKRADFIEMHRTQSSPGVFDGALVGEGDSGGALTILRARGDLTGMYLLGVISQSGGNAWCEHELANYDFTSGMATTFGADTGPFIQSQMKSWLDVVYIPAPGRPRPLPLPFRFRRLPF